MPRTRWARCTMFALVIAATVASTGGGAAGAAASVAPRLITFGAAPTGQSSVENVFTMGGGGGNLRQLTKDGRSLNPVLSPDGRWIAYTKTFAAAGDRTQWDLMLMRVDGSGKRRLTSTSAATEYPTSWSPDSSKIVISRLHHRKDSRNGVFAIRRDGSGLRRLLGPRYRGADWSPVGRQLVAVYITDPGSGMRQIARINVNGTGRELLTGKRHASEGPRWSPDGTQVVYSEEQYNTFTGNRIRVMNADGSAKRTLADTGGNDMFPDWSPDGTAVVFWEPGYPSSLDKVIVATGKVTKLRTAYARDLSW